MISADSHVTEHPDTYRKYIDPSLRDRAPHLASDGAGGDVFMIPDLTQGALPMGLIAAAGTRSEDIRMSGRFADWHRGGWDPEARLADQDRDGVVAEVLYPTVGLVLCRHQDLDYKKACMDAYNRWLAEYCDAHPARLLGVGQTAVRTPAEGIEDLRAIKALGLRGVMLPSRPGQADWDSPAYDEFFEAAIDLALPVSFHILTDPMESLPRRGPVMNFAVGIIRSNQDVISMLIYGGVFERHPRLRVVCVEADASWAPHWMHRMDHYYDRHRYMRALDLSRPPSEYFGEHVYLTFQDDWPAFRMLGLLNPRRLMWANDFPHSDSTWPSSQELLAREAAHLTDDERARILHDNVSELYGLQTRASARIVK
jgi:predicted TIM-barrel fold metal-dependent hydrolase